MTIREMAKSKIAVNCHTEGDIVAMLAICSNFGLRFAPGVEDWNEYERDTCYIVKDNEVVKKSRSDCEANGYTIHDMDDIEVDMLDYSELGELCMTAGIAECMKTHKNYDDEIAKCVVRYLGMDWSELCKEDRLSNWKAVVSGDARILVPYNTSCGRIYIITEWDRSVTTILFTEEY